MTVRAKFLKVKTRGGERLVYAVPRPVKPPTNGKRETERRQRQLARKVKGSEQEN